MERTILAVIKSGGYDLDKLIERIRYYHVSGELTDEQCESLIEAARSNAVRTMGVDAKTEILALWDAVHELQKEIAALKQKPQTGETGEDGEIPEYVQPTGAHDAYNTGDRVTFGGKVYECIINSCVWSPEAYPAGWQEVTE